MGKRTILFKAENHPALHPGQTASIYHKERKDRLVRRITSHRADEAFDLAQ